MLTRILFFVLTVALLVAAGASLVLKTGGVWLWLAVGVLFLFSFGRECSVRAAAPLTHLKPNTYHVDAVLHVSNDVVLLAVSWHVDYGHYEYRIARLPNQLFCPRVPVDGDEIRVSRAVPHAYYVHPTHPAPPPPSTVPCIG